MRDLKTTISSCLEHTLGSNYTPTQGFSSIGKVSFMPIPLTGDYIELPTMVTYSLPTIGEKILKKEPIDALVANLNNTGGYSPYKSVEACIKDIFSVSYETCRLRKLTNIKDSEKLYYGTYGAIFDECFKPIVMLSWELKKVYRDDEQNPFRYQFFKPILRVAPEVFINKSNAVERFITNKIVPTALSISNIYCPFIGLNRGFDMNTNSNLRIKVLIEDCPFIIKEVDVPSISTTNEELLRTALNHIDELIE